MKPLENQSSGASHFDLKANPSDTKSWLSALSETYGVWFLTICALVLRLINLDVSFWYDEGYTGHMSRLYPSEIIAFLTREDVHPPLYYFLIRGWAEIFPGDVGLRYFSVLAGTLTVPIFFNLCRKLFDSRTAFVAAVFLTISNFHVQYSQEVRAYSFYILLATVALWFLVTAIRSKRTWNVWWFAYSVTAALITYTHGVGIIFLMGISAFHLCLIGIKDRTQLLQWLVFNALAVALSIPWLVITVRQSMGPNLAYSWLPPVSIKSILSTVEWYIYSPPAQKNGRFVHILWLFPQVALIFSAFFVGDSDRRKKVAALALLFVVPVVVISIYGYITTNIFVGRVLAPVVLPLLILSALPVVAFQKTVLRRPIQILTVAALIFSLIGTTASLRARRGTDWRGAAAYIGQQIQPDDAILVMPDTAQYIFGYYFQNDGENRNVIPITKVGDVSALVPGLFTKHRRIWIIRDEVVSSPLTSDSREWLEQRYKNQAVENFDGVDVLLLQP